MKIRKGFVSNSSSSSFILASRGELEMSDQIVTEVFKVEKSSPMFDLSNRVIKLMMNKSEKIDNFDEWLDHEYGTFDDADDYKKEVLAYSEVKMMKELFDKNFIVRKGSFYNDSGDSLEEFLCDGFSFEYDGEDLFIKNERY